MTIYSLEKDQPRIHAMQAVALDALRPGLSPHPALIGTPEWWLATEDGSLPRSAVSGVVSRLYWEGMGDWPTCDVTDTEGVISRRNREGDVSRYVEGLQVKFRSVFHPWKTADPSWRLAYLSLLGPASEIVLTVEIEDSDRRSDARPPGPGGAGLRMR